MCPSHGALSKSGKVRNLNRKEFRKVKDMNGYTGKTYYHKRKHESPIRKNREKFYKNFVLKRRKKRTRMW